MRDPMLFERDPERYRRARPGYPEELWDVLAEVGLARPGARVLDVGAGTGQASGPLLARGLEVDAIEPGPGLAAALRRELPRVVVQVAGAEQADYARGSYDAVVCATALHWLDLRVVLPRFRDCLRPGGVLVAFWNVFFDPTAPSTPFRQAMDERYDGPPTVEGTPLDVGHWSKELTRAGLFAVDAVHTWQWTHRMTTAELVDLVSTFNGWTDDDVAAAAEAADRLGGSVTEHYSTIAYVCRPLDPT